jgi:hypothetical protein
MTARPQFRMDELAACAERELAFRRRVYARRVMLGKMKQEAADRETALMEAILGHLRQAAEAETLFGRSA